MNIKNTWTAINTIRGVEKNTLYSIIQFGLMAAGIYLVGGQVFSYMKRRTTLPKHEE